MYKPVLVAAPQETPITLAEAKVNLRVDGSDEDGLIEGLIAAAVSHLDGWSGILGRCLVTQTWRMTFDQFAPCLRLPMPAASISTIYSVDDAGTVSAVSDSNYQLREDALGSYVRFDAAFSFSGDLAQSAGVSVEFVAGYGAAAAVPAALKHAMHLLIGHWYANREAVNVGNITTELPLGAKALLAPFSRLGL
jgi:uncharacterized phiE125 gp8 family phage protein